MDVNRRAVAFSSRPPPPATWHCYDCFPRDADECVRDEGMLFSQQVKTVAHIVELPNFVQDRISDAWVTRLS